MSPDRKVDAWLVNRVRTFAGFLHRSTCAVRQGAGREEILLVKRLGLFLRQE